MELEFALERCSARCPECGKWYDVIVTEDEESPLVCDRCGTLGVRM